MKHIKFLIGVLLAAMLLAACAPNKAAQPYGVNYIDDKSIKAESTAPAEAEKAAVPVAEAPKEITPAETPKPAEEVKPVEKPVEKAPEVKPAEKLTSNAIVLMVKENEMVSLKPEAEDPDKDKLAYTYTSPLDANGKWQTKYGDAGQYTVTVTASDGKLTSSRDVLLIVNKKEEAPTIDNFMPPALSLTAKENAQVNFSVKASDLNKDTLTYVWKLDGKEVSNSPTYTYKISYDDAGSHTVKASVSDKITETTKLWAVTVDNVNRKPVMQKIADVKAKENDKVVITAVASDPDGDALKYSVDNKKFEQSGNVFTWQTGYDDSGSYDVVVTVSDGKDSVTQTVKVALENVNRAPVIKNIVKG